MKFASAFLKDQNSSEEFYYWIFQITGWFSVWILKAIGTFLEPDVYPHPFHSFYWGFYFLCLMGCSHGYRLFLETTRWNRLNWEKLFPRIAGASLCVSVLNSSLCLMLLNAHLVTDFSKYLFLLLIKTTILGFLLMMIWSALYFGYHHQKRFQEMRIHQLGLQAALKEAKHQALRAQVNPHFLFNSLNTLRSLIEENPERARTAVTELALIFRASLQTSSKDLISLKEELETVQAYLSLERARHEERLRIHKEISHEALDALLPPFLLQTLIENAVKYGVAPRPEGAEIRYCAFMDSRGLVLRVTNPGQIDSSSTSTGIGLENSRLRLRLLFGAEAFLTLTAPQADQVLAEAIIPQVRRLL